MRPLRLIISILVPAFFVASLTGCSRCRLYQYTDAPQGQALLNSSPNFEDVTSLAKWSAPVTEKEKIGYLLGRIAKSQHTFIRNGEPHDGKTARQWFLYKMAHWVDDVDTAEDFVARVASYSQRTGEPYLVQFPDGHVYSLKSVLANEISNLTDRISHLKSVPDRALTQQPTQISLTPAAVASTAVAASTSS